MSERYYRCACGSSSAALPSQALRAKAGLRLPASASLSLASCWPLPQQLLPVPAAGGGRRRCPQRGSLGLCGMQKPLPMGEVAAKQTERASPAGQSCHAAISRPSVRAMLLPRLQVRVSVLALSVTFGDSSPKGGASDEEGYCRRCSQKIETRGIKR